jgi:TP901 family phage tail tape measure protein
MSLRIRTEQIGLEQSIDDVVNRINRRGINVKIRASDFTQPLGRITQKADEFSKSLEASNARVIAFGASAAIIGGVTTSFKELIVQAVKVEKILTDINVVLGTSSANLKKFGRDLFAVAKNTSQALEVAAEAALEFSRQGLSLEETLKRTNDALILTRLTGIDAANAVSGLTAAVNGFADAGLTTTQIINKLAAVDVKFAVSADDLIDALARAGAVAQDAGVNFDQLVGAVTAAQQITARGGAVIGNSFKTIFTRIQRSSTLDRLEELGVAVRDIQGNTLPAIRVLENLAKTYQGLGDATSAAIAEQVGGVFQINVLKAALKDLTKENSLYAQATEISSRATNQAEQKNAQLQKTISSLATQTSLTVQELSARIGELALSPGISKLLDAVQSFAGTLNDLLGEGENTGSTFAKGFVKGLGSVITGPGVVLAFGVFAKLFANAFKFAKSSLKDVLGIVSAKDKEKSIQEAIVLAMSQNKQLALELNKYAGDKNKQEQIMLTLIKEQTKYLLQQDKIAAGLATKLARAGVKSDLTLPKSKLNTSAQGFVPNYSLSEPTPIEQEKEKAMAVKSGYMPGKVKKMRINGMGEVIYNNAETVTKFKGFQQPAIMPPENSRAGKKYSKSFESKHGFDPYASGGFIPNMAAAHRVGSTLNLPMAKMFVQTSATERGKMIRGMRTIKAKVADIPKHGGANLAPALQELKSMGINEIQRRIYFTDLDPRGRSSADRQVKDLAIPKGQQNKFNDLIGNVYEQNLDKKIKNKGFLRTHTGTVKYTGKRGGRKDARKFIQDKKGKGDPSATVDYVRPGHLPLEAKANSFSEANLIAKSLYLYSDKSLDNFLQNNNLEQVASLYSNVKLDRQKSTLQKMGYDPSEEMIKAFNLASGFLPNFADPRSRAQKIRDVLADPANKGIKFKMPTPKHFKAKTMWDQEMLREFQMNPRQSYLGGSLKDYLIKKGYNKKELEALAKNPSGYKVFSSGLIPNFVEAKRGSRYFKGVPDPKGKISIWDPKRKSYQKFREDDSGSWQQEWYNQLTGRSGDLKQFLSWAKKNKKLSPKQVNGLERELNQQSQSYIDSYRETQKKIKSGDAGFYEKKNQNTTAQLPGDETSYLTSFVPNQKMQMLVSEWKQSGGSSFNSGLIPNFARQKVEAITKVKDGDSIVGLVSLGSREVDHRLSGVDAVEKDDNPFGPQATTLAQTFYPSNKQGVKHLESTRVTEGQAAYDRGLIKDDRLAQSLLMRGLGVPDLRYGGTKQYGGAVKQAKKMKKGIWADGYEQHPKRLAFESQMRSLDPEFSVKTKGDPKSLDPKFQKDMYQVGSYKYTREQLKEIKKKGPDALFKMKFAHGQGGAQQRYKDIKKVLYTGGSGSQYIKDGLPRNQKYFEGLVPNFGLRDAMDRYKRKKYGVLNKDAFNSTSTAISSFNSTNALFAKTALSGAKGIKLTSRNFEKVRQFLNSKEFRNLEPTIQSKVKKDLRIQSRNLDMPDVTRPWLQHSDSSFMGRVAAPIGLIPNFADALSAAIQREAEAGIPKSLMRIETDPSLQNPQNPLGLAVTNKIDEPGGVKQGIDRAKKMGIDPQKHGASNGLIPNYSKTKSVTVNTKEAEKSIKEVGDQAKDAADSLGENAKVSQDLTGRYFMLTSVAYGLQGAFQGVEGTTGTVLKAFSTLGEAGSQAMLFGEGLGQVGDSISKKFSGSKGMLGMVGKAAGFLGPFGMAIGAAIPIISYMTDELGMFQSGLDKLNKKLEENQKSLDTYQGALQAAEAAQKAETSLQEIANSSMKNTFKGRMQELDLLRQKTAAERSLSKALAQLKQSTNLTSAEIKIMATASAEGASLMRQKMLELENKTFAQETVQDVLETAKGDSKTKSTDLELDITRLAQIIYSGAESNKKGSGAEEAKNIKSFLEGKLGSLAGYATEGAKQTALTSANSSGVQGVSMSGMGGSAFLTAEQRYLMEQNPKKPLLGTKKSQQGTTNETVLDLIGGLEGMDSGEIADIYQKLAEALDLQLASEENKTKAIQVDEGAVRKLSQMRADLNSSIILEQALVNQKLKLMAEQNEIMIASKESQLEFNKSLGNMTKAQQIAEEQKIQEAANSNEYNETVANINSKFLQQGKEALQGMIGSGNKFSFDNVPMSEGKDGQPADFNQKRSEVISNLQGLFQKQNISPTMKKEGSGMEGGVPTKESSSTGDMNIKQEEVSLFDVLGSANNPKQFQAALQTYIQGLNDLNQLNALSIALETSNLSNRDVINNKLQDLIAEKNIELETAQTTRNSDNEKAQISAKTKNIQQGTLEWSKQAREAIANNAKYSAESQDVALERITAEGTMAYIKNQQLAAEQEGLENGKLMSAAIDKENLARLNAVKQTEISTAIIEGQNSDLLTNANITKAEGSANMDNQTAQNVLRSNQLQIMAQQLQTQEGINSATALELSSRLLAVSETEKQTAENSAITSNVKLLQSVVKKEISSASKSATQRSEKSALESELAVQYLQSAEGRAESVAEILAKERETLGLKDIELQIDENLIKDKEKLRQLINEKIDREDREAGNKETTDTEDHKVRMQRGTYRDEALREKRGDIRSREANIERLTALRANAGSPQEQARLNTELTKEVMELNSILGTGSQLLNTWAVRIAEANENIANFSADLANTSFDAVQDSFRNLFDDISSGAKSSGEMALDFFGGIAKKIQGKMFDMAAEQLTAGMFKLFAPKFHTGGFVGRYANGGSTREIPAMLTTGEYVVRKKIVDKLGTNTMDKINETGDLETLYDKPNEDQFDLSSENSMTPPPIVKFENGGSLEKFLINQKKSDTNSQNDRSSVFSEKATEENEGFNLTGKSLSSQDRDSELSSRIKALENNKPQDFSSLEDTLNKFKQGGSVADAEKPDPTKEFLKNFQTRTDYGHLGNRWYLRNENSADKQVQNSIDGQLGRSLQLDQGGPVADAEKPDPTKEFLKNFQTRTDYGHLGNRWYLRNQNSADKQVQNSMDKQLGRSLQLDQGGPVADAEKPDPTKEFLKNFQTRTDYGHLGNRWYLRNQNSADKQVEVSIDKQLGRSLQLDQGGPVADAQKPDPTKEFLKDFQTRTDYGHLGNRWYLRNENSADKQVQNSIEKQLGRSLQLDQGGPVADQFNKFSKIEGELSNKRFSKSPLSFSQENNLPLYVDQPFGKGLKNEDLNIDLPYNKIKEKISETKNNVIKSIPHFNSGGSTNQLTNEDRTAAYNNISKGLGTLAGTFAGSKRQKGDEPKGPTAPKVNRVNTSSRLNIDPRSNRMTARFRRNDSYSQDYGKYLLDKYEFDIQQQNQKAEEKYGNIAAIAQTAAMFVGMGIGNKINDKFGLNDDPNAPKPVQDPPSSVLESNTKKMEGQYFDPTVLQRDASGNLVAVGNQTSQASAADFAQMKAERNSASLPISPQPKSNPSQSIMDKFGPPQPSYSERVVNAGNNAYDALSKMQALYTAEPERKNQGGLINRYYKGGMVHNFTSVGNNITKMKEGGLTPNGKVFGAGGIDQVGPVMLDRGEYVVKASSVSNVEKQYPGFFDKLNSMKFNQGGMVKGDSPVAKVASGDTVDNSQTNSETNSSNVTVNINVSGGNATIEGGNGDQQAFATKIKEAVLGIVSQERRVGGMLRG